MSLSTWLAFVVASWLISLSPGAGAISCMAAGMRYGYARGLWNVFGLQLGILFVLATVKWLGVGYLIWRGVQQWRAPARPLADTDGANDRASRRDLVVRGFLVNATNPKGILFMLAVLPQFIDPARPQLAQYAICAATLAVTDLIVMSAYTGLASRLLAALREPHHIRVVNRTFGGLFVAAGALLATFRRAA